MASNLDWWGRTVVDLNQYWEPDPGNRVIRTKDLTGWRRYRLRWWKRFAVKEIYVWIQSTWATQDMMIHEIPIFHGGFKLSSSLQRKLPRMFQLKNGWTIRESDLKYLKRGPLVSEDGERVIIPSYGWFLGSIIWLADWRFIGRFLEIAGALITIAGALYWLFG